MPCSAWGRIYCVLVGNDNCVSYKGTRLDRYSLREGKGLVHEYSDGSMSIYHGKRKVGEYDSEGQLENEGGISRPKAHIGYRSFTSPSSGSPDN